MTQSKKLEKNQTIEFRITEIKKISYFQNDFSVYGLVKSDISKGEVSLSINFQLVEEVESVAVYVNTNFSVNKDEKRIELFGIETIHTFAIRNIKNKFYDEKYKNYDIPDNILLTFLNMSVSGTRGMLVALCSNPAYSNIILPIINPFDLLNAYKEKNKKALLQSPGTNRIVRGKSEEKIGK